MSSLIIDRRLRVPSTRSTAPAEARAGARTRATRRRLLAPVGVLVGLALLAVFVALGASRMIEVTGHRGHTVAPAAAGAHVPSGYGASLWPLGFTVHWNDGTDETHLWW